jgi:protein TonB
METKKTLVKNLEKKRFMFFEIALIIVLFFVASAFEYSVKEIKNVQYGEVSFGTDDSDLIDITRPEPPKPEPPKPKPETLPVEFDIKEDDVLVTDTVEFDSGADQKTKIDTKIKYYDNNEEKKEEIETLNVAAVQFKPEFPGGEAALLRFIQKNTNYPQRPKEEGISGKVYVQFIISSTGEVVQAEVLRPIDPYLDAEAIRVINMMPNWKPGYQGVNPVNCIFILPIKFVLSN